MMWKLIRLTVLAAFGVAVFGVAMTLVFTPLTVRLTRWVLSDVWASLDAAGRAAAAGQLRLAIVQVVAAVGAGIALGYTARTFRLTRRGQVTDRFTKALERLSSDKPYVRLGGVLAMEQIVQDAPDQGAAAMHVLNAFVRKEVPATATSKLVAVELAEKPDAQVQEALRVLTTPPRWRGIGSAPLNLTSLHLRKVHLADAHLKGARLKGATLLEADLRGAKLSDADLTDADLTSADLTNADLKGADLTGAVMSSALGLTVAQVLQASSLTGCVLPAAVAADSAVEGRLTRSE